MFPASIRSLPSPSVQAICMLGGTQLLCFILGMYPGFRTPNFGDLARWERALILWRRVSPLCSWCWLVQKSCSSFYTGVGVDGKAQQRAGTKFWCPQQTHWCPPTLLSPERPCHFSQVHSKKRNCLSQCDLGDPQIILSALGPCPPSPQEHCCAGWSLPGGGRDF